VEQLGSILHYTKQDEWSTYPHDRVCVMWDLRRTVPERIKIKQSNVTFWQPIDFKTLPQMCFICCADTHLAHTCPRCPIKVDPLLEGPIQRLRKVTNSTVTANLQSSNLERDNITKSALDSQSKVSRSMYDQVKPEVHHNLNQMNTKSETQIYNTVTTRSLTLRYEPMIQDQSPARNTTLNKSIDKNVNKVETDFVAERLGIPSMQPKSLVAKKKEKKSLVALVDNS
jgi:hypothetical protein